MIPLLMSDMQTVHYFHIVQSEDNMMPAGGISLTVLIFGVRTQKIQKIHWDVGITRATF